MATRQLVDNELSTKLEDPAFRYQIRVSKARTDETRRILTRLVSHGDFYEAMGILVKTGLVDRALVFELWSSVVIAAWKKFAPLTAIFRRQEGDGVWENFEYLTVLAQDWNARQPGGTYPVGVRRIDIQEVWLEADKQYDASLAPA